MGSLQERFLQSRQLGLHLSSDDVATFKRLAVEAKSILDHELGLANDFSLNLVSSINSASSVFSNGPSLLAVKSARELVLGGANQIRRKPALEIASKSAQQGGYVSASRIAELRALRSGDWDLSRLVRLLEELNAAHISRSYMSVAMLVRAILDHCPPIFGCSSFSEVANNFRSSKSFRASVQNLQNSLRNIADAHLHLQIRKSEVLPAEAQVDFRSDLDVLLGEIVRLLK